MRYLRTPPLKLGKLGLGGAWWWYLADGPYTTGNAVFCDEPVARHFDVDPGDRIVLCLQDQPPEDEYGAVGARIQWGISDAMNRLMREAGFRKRDCCVWWWVEVLEEN